MIYLENKEDHVRTVRINIGESNSKHMIFNSQNCHNFLITFPRQKLTLPTSIAPQKSLPRHHKLGMLQGFDPQWGQIQAMLQV